MHVKPSLVSLLAAKKSEFDEDELNRFRTPLDASKATAALIWWSNAGVTHPVEDAPRDRFAEDAASALDRSETAASNTAARQEEQSSTSGRSGGKDATGSHPALEFAARAGAAACPDLAALRAELERFNGCALKKTATQLVFSDGVPGSRVMLVGEAPGGEEDRIGRPFVGRAGQLLDRMLSAIRLDRNSVYIANVVPWRPPGNRTPTPQEIQACLPFIRRQIELAGPEILVCLGASAAQTLLGLHEGIMRTRGTWFTYVCEDGRSIRTIPMLHPAYLLRQPGQKRWAWSDMRALASALEAA